MINFGRKPGLLTDTSSVWHLMLVWLLAMFISVVLFLPAYIVPICDCMLLTPEGDGLKGYFATIWQTLYGHGAWFNGMSYPYGDNVTFADGQYLLIIALQFIDKYILPLGPGHIVGIIILLVLQGIVLAQVAVYYLLRRAAVSFWFAFIGAFLVAYQAPQIDRVLAGHISLSYVFVIPTVWLLLDTSVRSSKGWLAALLSMLLITASAFVHMYYLPMLVLFALSFYSVSFMLTARYNMATGLRYVGLMVVAVLPLLLVKFWVNATDLFTDRIAIPSGLEAYRASWFSVFLPQQLAPAGAYYQFEGIAYVGLAGLPLLLWIAWRISSKLWAERDPKKMVMLVRSKTMAPAFWVGIPFLLLAKGSIVLWLLDKWPDVFEFLRQFRSLGRFAWIFYFTMSILGIYALYISYRSLRLKTKPLLGFALVAMFLLPSLYTTVQYVKPLTLAVRGVSLRQCATRLWMNSGTAILNDLEDQGLSADQFQAILPLPYYNLGSEKYFLARTNSSRYLSFSTAISSGLPIMGQYMARSSVGLTAKQMQLLGNDLLRKDILNDLSDMPILVLYTGEELNKAEQALLDKCQLVSRSENEASAIYALNPDVLYKAWEEAQNAASELRLVDSTNETCLLHWDSYSEAVDIAGKDGNGAWKAIATDDLLWQGEIADSGICSISFWMEIDTIYHSFPQVYVTAGSVEIHADPQEYYDTHNGWLRVALDVQMQQKEKLSIRIESQGELARIDNLLISKKACGNVITTGSSGMRYLNNFPIRSTQ